MNTLSELAAVAARVDEKIKNIGTITTAKEFSELQNDLNNLQAAARDYAPVVKARAIWYDHGLESFEKHFVQPTCAHVDGWEEWHQNYCGGYSSPPNLIMHWETLRCFLTRSYLGKPGFNKRFARVQEMLDRLISSSPLLPSRTLLWTERAKQLQQYEDEGWL